VHTWPPDHCGLFVSADHAETPALCIASFVTNALLSPRALAWIQCLETMTLMRPALTSVPSAPHKVLLAVLALFPAMHFSRRLKTLPISARPSQNT